MFCLTTSRSFLSLLFMPLEEEEAPPEGAGVPKPLLLL